MFLHFSFSLRKFFKSRSLPGNCWLPTVHCTLKPFFFRIILANQLSVAGAYPGRVPILCFFLYKSGFQYRFWLCQPNPNTLFQLALLCTFRDSQVLTLRNTLILELFCCYNSSDLVAFHLQFLLHNPRYLQVQALCNFIRPSGDAPTQPSGIIWRPSLSFPAVTMRWQLSLAGLVSLHLNQNDSKLIDPWRHCALQLRCSLLAACKCETLQVTFKGSQGMCETDC